MSLYVDFNACFFAVTFQPMNAALTFQIGLNGCARAIRGKFTFAGAWESFQGISTYKKMYRCFHSNDDVLPVNANLLAYSFKLPFM